mmetsp:Transcript_5259/g.14202  ORF Transcript_5259/g.14202 Transcript_5259/m.14202 type:complete len:99 (-) Transcript_5259:529-825(-)|eukprot:CAMPEP_0198109152 /NCGR_PEP_ID=MMETSP1442-20131203/1159_1 /TAXON_ID= /ORGANISM="Craspedostauros australis, Strain CCMP3328" /LENGTH=98 /DNA_ID=CAMNT_0043764673 /DNA_START=204 /DNA_END=500 /DNA_ORIENTATION=+
MCSDLGATSRCCMGYSIVGALFTFWVGMMLTTQPFFIGGIEEVDHAKESAFGAFGTFIFTFIVSVIGIWYDSQNKAEEMEEGDYQLGGGDVPNYGAAH